MDVNPGQCTGQFQGEPKLEPSLTAEVLLQAPENHEIAPALTPGEIAVAANLANPARVQAGPPFSVRCEVQVSMA